MYPFHKRDESKKPLTFYTEEDRLYKEGDGGAMKVFLFLATAVEQNVIRMTAHSGCFIGVNNILQHHGKSSSCFAAKAMKTYSGLPLSASVAPPEERGCEYVQEHGPGGVARQVRAMCSLGEA